MNSVPTPKSYFIKILLSPFYRIETMAERDARNGDGNPVDNLHELRYERLRVPKDWNQVSISIEKADRGPFDAMGFSKLEIWCGGAMVADFVKESNCETLWLGGGSGPRASEDGQSDPCYEKTNRRKMHAIYNRPKGICYFIKTFAKTSFKRN